MITDQVHPKTGKVIRRVEVLSVDEKQETATVKALNGPLAGSVYTVGTHQLARTER